MSSAETEPETAEEWVLQEVDHRVDAEPDGVQDAQSDVWTSKQRLRDDGRKSSTKYPKDEVEAAVERLKARDEILSWHGLLAPATDEHVRAVIGNENAADITRSSLIETCRALLSDDESGGASA